jgi:hypothetical protein
LRDGGRRAQCLAQHGIAYHNIGIANDAGAASSALRRRRCRTLDKPALRAKADLPKKTNKNCRQGSETEI